MGIVRVDPKFIPLDKSKTIRSGVLDALSGRDSTLTLLRSQPILSDDLKALLRASEEWLSNERVIHVGESGTLYRFLKFASWKYGLDKSFVLEGTLRDRRICDDPRIINLPILELLKLDNRTSQWASAAVLMGNREVAQINEPYKLQVTRQVLKQWEAHKTSGRPMPVQYDETILRQAQAFANRIDGGVIFAPQQAEDYCFARVFGLMSKNEGARRWPSLAGHESNRIESVERALKSLRSGSAICTTDHRVMQAVAMLAVAKQIDIGLGPLDCVNKSWPQFWDFLEAYA
jgi:hypothetical protein